MGSELVEAGFLRKFGTDLFFFRASIFQRDRMFKPIFGAQIFGAQIFTQILPLIFAEIFRRFFFGVWVLQI